MAMGTTVPHSPRNIHHRRYLCIDAVSRLDMDALYDLICHHSANLNDITLAAEQTGRSIDELADALRVWLPTADLSLREIDRLTATLTQPPLPLDLEF